MFVWWLCADHRVLDFWLLTIIYSLGGGYERSAWRLLRKKLSCGLANKEWLKKSIAGHQVGSVVPSL